MESATKGRDYVVADFNELQTQVSVAPPEPPAIDAAAAAGHGVREAAELLGVNFE